MRKLTQFVAALAICLVAVQPALAGLPCTAGFRSACAPGCPMAMNSMGTNCPMSGAMTAGDCLQNCCVQAHPQAIVLAAVVSKLHAAVIASASAFFGTSIAARPGLVLRNAAIADASSPPLYVRNRVFRI